MTQTKRKRRSMLTSEVAKGPSMETILDILEDILDQNQSPIIPLFGSTPNGHREWPIRITKIQTENGLLTFDGVIDFRDCPEERGTKALQGVIVKVFEYSPYTRKATCIYRYD